MGLARKYRQNDHLDNNPRSALVSDSMRTFEKPDQKPLHNKRFNPIHFYGYRNARCTHKMDCFFLRRPHVFCSGISTPPCRRKQSSRIVFTFKKTPNDRAFLYVV